MITHTRSEFVTRWFSNHAKCSLQKNFSKCSLTKESQIPTFEENIPVIAVSNHSSWWDALLGLYVGQYVFKKEMYGVFKEEQLRRYGIFRFVGAYSVDQESLGDVKEFLRYTHELLKDTSRLLWIYPQGTLSSNNILPFDFKKGFANIAARFKKVHIFKMVVSYDFWIEPKPEIVIDFLPLETLEPEKGSAFQDALTDLDRPFRAARVPLLLGLRRLGRDHRAALPGGGPGLAYHPGRPALSHHASHRAAHGHRRLLRLRRAAAQPAPAR